MSSHHFVKEGQEPALFIADLVAVSHVEALLEWAPLVVALHTTVHDVILRGTKVDAVIAPTAEADLFERQLQDQAPIDIISSAPGQELVAGPVFPGTERSASRKYCRETSRKKFSARLCHLPENSV